MEKELSKTPYFVDALRNWAMDSGHTPYLMVLAESPDVNLPFEKIEAKDGLVCLNISDSAVREYCFGDNWMSFKTRFSGVSYQVDLPAESLHSIYVPEAQYHVRLEQDKKPVLKAESATSETKKTNDKGKGKPNLRLVD